MKEKIRIGVIGCGRISLAHREACKNLIDEVKIEAIADINNKNLSRFTEGYRVPHIFNDYHKILQDKNVDAVIVCVPHDLHEKITIDALEMRKHVLIEKPMALDYKQAKNMVNKAKKNRRRLMVGQSRRYSYASLKMKQMIDNGEIGDLFRVIINFLVFFKEAPTNWWNIKKSAGELITLLQGSHSIDTSIWLFDKIPLKVFSNNFIKNFALVDEGDIFLDFRNASASIHLSLNTKPPIYEVLAIGNKGILKLSENQIIGTFHFKNRLELNNKVILESKQDPSNYTLQLQEFLDSIREDRESLTEGNKILKVMKVISAAVKSFNSKEVVTL